MFVSFDIQFIRRDQKQRKNGEACRASPACFWASQINLISKDTKTWFSIDHVLLADLMAKRQQNNWKADAIYPVKMLFSRSMSVSEIASKGIA